ncbi:MAG: zinc-dependent metalloprotease [Phycisphaerales bacterium]|nr:zinc-dependent metalloprotease [Phycisphaerales bacterium]
MLTGRNLLAVAVAIGFAYSVLAVERNPADPQSQDAPSIVLAVGGGSAASSADDGSSLPDFNKVTEGMERLRPQEKNFLTLWRFAAESRKKGKDPERLLAQIPSQLLGQQFMISTSVSGGGFFTGFPLAETVVRWELHGRQVLLIEPETGFVVDESREVADVVARTYPERIRIATPLITKTPSGDPVIDLGELLKSDFADIGWMMFDPVRINPQLSKWTAVKPFELNVEIGVELAIAQTEPAGAHEKVRVHFSFWSLPKTDYRPRAADNRVGYFLTTNRDWSKPVTERDIFNRYINRWHLVKRDASLRQCEPRNPIVFYIEKTVPVRYRRAVRDGILEWNRAFEKIGFVNAIEVRQQTEDNEWKDLDPEDMRYSFIRWIVTGAGFAMGPSRANPFTGQIYDADIIFDDAMVRYFEQEAQRMLPATAAAMKFNDPTLKRFLEASPEWQRPDRPWQQFVSARDVKERELRERAQRRLHQCGDHACDHMQGKQHQMALGKAALAGQPPEVIERFLYEMIKEVVMHEVGHTLGLRHNFKASSIYTLDEIKRRRTTGEATVGSVMDYNPALLIGKDPLDGAFITPTIGPYDYWAIEYGYRPLDAHYKSPAGPATRDAGDGAAGRVASPDLAAVNTPPGGEVRTSPGGAASNPSADTDGVPGTPSGAAQSPSFPAPPDGEAAMLREIASRASEPELAFATDEDATFLAPDPLVNRFDVGRDPIEWAKARVELVDARLANLLDWGVKENESWHHLRGTFITLWFEKAIVMDYVGRIIGGQYFHRTNRGDPSAPPPFVNVDPDMQRRALRFIADSIYRDGYFAAPADVLNHLAPPRWWHEGAMVSFVLDMPVHEFIAVLQWWNLFDRLFPTTLQRIQDNELRSTDANKLTFAEYLTTLQNAVWADAVDPQRLTQGKWDDSRPFISSTRRSLQREYLGLVEPLVRQRPGRVLSNDVHGMLTHALRKLSAQLEGMQSAGTPDFASQAHLVECKQRIDRMLAAQLNEFQPMR